MPNHAVATSALESNIRDLNHLLASTRDQIKSIETRISEYTNRLIQKNEIVENINEDIVKLNEAINILESKGVE